VDLSKDFSGANTTKQNKNTKPIPKKKRNNGSILGMIKQ